MVGSPLFSQSADVIIYILCFLDPPNLIRFSWVGARLTTTHLHLQDRYILQTCSKIWQICSLRIVWTNACRYHVINNGYPFAPDLLSSFPMPQLRFKVLAAYHLANRWISGVPCSQPTYCVSGTSGTYVSDVRFVPGYDDRLLLTISKTIWSAMSLWYMSDQDSILVAHWSPRGAIFTGYTVNNEAGSKATIALSLQLYGDFSVKVFHVTQGPDAKYAFQEIYTVVTDMKPITLLGDLLALADSTSRTAIWNWKDSTSAILQHSTEPSSYTQYNDCMQVLFAHESVLVVRAHSIHLFPYPDLRPHDINTPLFQAEYHQIAQHSFGWVDGIAASICPLLSTSKCSGTPISILVRGESDDPWAQDAHYLELYSLLPNTGYAQQKLEVQHLDTLCKADSDFVSKRDSLPSPYIFPPCKDYHINSHRGALRCKQVLLGKFGTAAWLEPQERFSTGLVAGLVPPTVDVGEQWRWQDAYRVQRHECLRVAVFPGSLSPHAETEVHSRSVLTNEANNWTSFDYDEIGGRIVLGSSFGEIVVIKV